MNLSNVKDNIDNYFENIDALELYKLSITRYKMKDFPMNKNLIEGAYLCTLNGKNLTNAIVAKIIDTSIYVLTDFGNILILSEDELFANYMISPGWIEHVALKYPYTSVEERAKKQIENLTESLNTLRNL